MSRAMFSISGRVQGVGYRAWARAEAEALGLVGWVRNRSDGGVEGEAEGPRASVERFLERCGEGPLLARVTGVQSTWVPAADPSEQGFVIRR